MTHRAATDIYSDLRSIERILNSGILVIEPRDPFFEDSLTRLFICLRDLIAKSSTYSQHHVNFRDDVIPSPEGARKKIRNVMHLIEFMRDAVSHPDADNHLLTPDAYLSFGRVVGKLNGTMIRIGGESKDPPCEYYDDIAFTFGYQRIYLKRHIVRAFLEARDSLLPVLDRFNKNPFPRN